MDPSNEPVLHTGPTGLTGTRTITTDPNWNHSQSRQAYWSKINGYWFFKPRTMATGPTGTRANCLTGPRHIGSGLSGNRTMATGPTEARAAANSLTGSGSWSWRTTGTEPEL